MLSARESLWYFLKGKDFGAICKGKTLVLSAKGIFWCSVQGRFLCYLQRKNIGCFLQGKDFATLCKGKTLVLFFFLQEKDFGCSLQEKGSCALSVRKSVQYCLSFRYFQLLVSAVDQELFDSSWEEERDRRS